MEISFTGHEGNGLVGTHFVLDGQLNGEVVLLLHGGGQTRHSWTATARELARQGHCAITLDLRGHGDSDWSAEGNYQFSDFADDVKIVVADLTENFGQKPVVIGTSLGGMAAMIFAGKAADLQQQVVLSGLVLVDITPTVKMDGVEKILGFMGSRSAEGFATLEEAADAIAAYLPHRPRPKDLSGLEKNLRLGKDGRYRWHWDPAFLASRKQMDQREVIEAQLSNAVRQLTMPVMLVRGRDSELVGDKEVAAFLEMVPHAQVADVSGARHMVAGDKNDVFAKAVMEFIDGL